MNLTNEMALCRFCGFENSKSTSLATQRLFGGEGRSSFLIPGATAHYAPDRLFRLEHIKIEVSLDPKKKSFEACVTQKVRAIAPGQTRIQLEQLGLEIVEVQQENENLSWSIQGEVLSISLSKSKIIEPGQVLEFSIRYRVHNPIRGIYFTGPDQDYPQKPFQVWTQGQDEDCRFWIPTFDYPNQKATSEVIARVPRGYTAVSNGALISSLATKDEMGEWTQYHYSLGTPHVTYLISLVVAEFSEWSDSGPRGLPVQYFVARGREEDGSRAFQNTPHMIRTFEEKTGVPYPYEKYSQVAVQDFIFGGMENTSATTQTDLTLHDARAHLDFSSDPLVSHELAHQWFGDLVTCRDWSHGWLNEGFATFMERVWIENKSGVDGGKSEAQYYAYLQYRQYLEEDQKKYRRPIVCNTYIEPIDLFDAHLYQKGGLVLNLIRSVLGENAFWKSVQFYLSRHRGQSVETLDLIRAIEEITGKNLRRFFDEWVFHAGYPEFEVSYQWHEEKKLTEWVIEQKQTEGLPLITKEGSTTSVFHLPVTLEMTFEDNTQQRVVLEIGEVRERVFLGVSQKPKWVRFDPDFNIPKTLKFSRPKEMLLEQLANDPDCMGRIEAAQELAKQASTEAISAIAKRAQKDDFWGVQVECSKLLGELRTPQARDGLIAALPGSHLKARRAMVTALGNFKESVVSQILKKYAEKDESYFVEASATQAWVSSCLQVNQKLAPARLEELQSFLNQQLEKSSYRDVIRSSCLGALSDLPGVGQGQSQDALNQLLEWTCRGRSMDARVAAVRALGKVLKISAAPERARILDAFHELSHEDHFRLRMQLVAALEESGSTGTLPVLGYIRDHDTDGRVKRSAKTAMSRLLTVGEVPESVSQLQTALAKLEEEHKKLRSWVEERMEPRSAEKLDKP